MNRTKVLRIAYLFAVVSAGCTSAATDTTGSGGAPASGTGGTYEGSGGSNNGSGGNNGGGTGGSPGIGGQGVGGGFMGTGGSGAGGRPGSGGNNGGGTGGTPAGSGGTQAALPTLVTSAPGAYWKTDGVATVVTAGTADVTVNDTTTSQTWEGFGGAFNEMGWNYLMGLSQTDRDHAMKLLFDATDGAHFVWGRIPIGASDYAIARYTEDESSGDSNLTNFSTTQDAKYLIPFVKAAQAVNSGIKFWASPWTPPTWMKTRSGSAATTNTTCGNPTWNNMSDSNVFDGGCMQDTNLATLANYFVKWIKAYSDQGITIDTLAPQNEPNYNQGYPSAIWAPATYTKFLPMLSSALSTAGLSTRIMLGTMSNGDNGATSKDLQVVQAVMADATAKSIPKVMGLQWGMLDLYTGKTSGVGPSNFMTGSMPVWATEHRCGNYPWNSSTYKEPAPNDQSYGVESWGFIRDAVKGGVTAYNAWNMVLDTVGKGNDLIRQWSQDALLIVNTSSKTLTLSPAYYVFRHVSQYAQVGAKVVSTTGGDAIAFKNPNGQIVAIMYNSGGAKTSIVSIGGKKLQFSMPGTGWATVTSQ
jgi:glucosylceramidase